MPNHDPRVATERKAGTLHRHVPAARGTSRISPGFLQHYIEQRLTRFGRDAQRR